MTNKNPDLTEFERLEKALKESEKKYRSLFEDSKDAIYFNTREGTVVDANKAALELFGYTKEDLPQVNVIDMYENPADRLKFQQEIEEKGAVRDYEVRLHGKDGKVHDCLLTTTVWRGNDGCILGYQGILRDITEQKRLDKALRESEEKLRAHAENLEKLVEERTLKLRDSEERYRGLYDSSIDGIASTSMDGNIIECNQAFSDMFGYPKAEIKRMNYLEFIPGKWRDIVARIISEQILPRGFSDVLEIEGCKRDGVIFPASARIWVIKDEEGRPARMWVLVRDITERKKLEGKLKAYTEKLKRLDEERAEELRRKTVELEALNKELEAFSYSVSHDLRAPLRSIDGFSKALLDDYIDVLDTEGRDYLQRVRKATKRMAAIIDELLALARVTRTEMHREKVDLSKMVQEILIELQESEPERQVEFIVEPGLVADGDARLLSLVFDNLLGNAWKFTGMKSIAKIEFGVTWKGIDRVFFVRDNGAGFNMDYVNKLFGAFQRLHSPEEFPGIGVGLATVKRIINRHGGRVWAEGEVGKGAGFYFTL